MFLNAFLQRGQQRFQGEGEHLPSARRPGEMERARGKGRNGNQVQGRRGPGQDQPAPRAKGAADLRKIQTWKHQYTGNW